MQKLITFIILFFSYFCFAATNPPSVSIDLMSRTNIYAYVDARLATNGANVLLTNNNTFTGTNNFTNQITVYMLSLGGTIRTTWPDEGGATNGIQRDGGSGTNIVIYDSFTVYGNASFYTNLSVASNIVANLYYGDGQHLTNLVLNLAPATNNDTLMAQGLTNYIVLSDDTLFRTVTNYYYWSNNVWTGTNISTSFTNHWGTHLHADYLYGNGVGITGLSSGVSVAAGTNGIQVTTNGSLVTISYTGTANLVNATNNDLLLGGYATNESTRISGNATNQSLLIGSNGTNNGLYLGNRATNNDLLIGSNVTNHVTLASGNNTNNTTQATNDLNTALRANITNHASLISGNATNEALLIGSNATNHVTLATNQAWQLGKISTNDSRNIVLTSITNHLGTNVHADYLYGNGTGITGLSTGVSVAQGTNGIQVVTNGSLVTVSYTGTGGGTGIATNSGSGTNNIFVTPTIIDPSFAGSTGTGLSVTNDAIPSGTHVDLGTNGTIFASSNIVGTLFYGSAVNLTNFPTLVAAGTNGIQVVTNGYGLVTISYTNAGTGGYYVAQGTNGIQVVTNGSIVTISYTGTGGTGSSNITDSLYYAVIRNLIVSTNATFNTATFTNTAGSNWWGGDTYIASNRVGGLYVSNGINLGGEYKTAWPSGSQTSVTFLVAGTGIGIASSTNNGVITYGITNTSEGGSIAFSGITAGENTAALTVGSGGSLRPNSGTIAATTLYTGATGTNLVVYSGLTSENTTTNKQILYQNQTIQFGVLGAGDGKILIVDQGTTSNQLQVAQGTGVGITNGVFYGSGAGLTALNLANATNNDLAMGTSFTNEATRVSQNATNQSLVIGAAATNESTRISGNATNQSLAIGSAATNEATRVSNNATSQVYNVSNILATARINSTNDLNTVLRANITNHNDYISNILATARINSTNDLNTVLRANVTNHNDYISNILATARINSTNDLNTALRANVTNHVNLATNNLWTAVTNAIRLPSRFADGPEAGKTLKVASGATSWEWADLPSLTSATNNDLLMGTAATNQSLLIGSNGTNESTRISVNATNNDTLVVANRVTTNDSRNLVWTSTTNNLGGDVKATKFWGDGTGLTGLSVGVSVAAGTNGIAAETNGSVVTIHYTGSGGSLVNATNNDLLLGGYATNEATRVSNNATNNDLLLGGYATNEATRVSNNATNNDSLVRGNVTNHVSYATNLMVARDAGFGTNILLNTNVWVREGILHVTNSSSISSAGIRVNGANSSITYTNGSAWTVIDGSAKVGGNFIHAYGGAYYGLVDNMTNAAGSTIPVLLAQRVATNSSDNLFFTGLTNRLGTNIYGVNFYGDTATFNGGTSNWWGGVTTITNLNPNLLATNAGSDNQVLSKTGNYLKWADAGGGIAVAAGTNGIQAVTNGSVITISYTNMSAGVVTNNKSFVFAAPTSTENITWFYTKYAITIDEIADYAGGSTPSYTYNIAHHATRTSGSSNYLFTANRAVTSAGTTSTFNDATIDAGSWVWIITSATSGTVSDANITITYH
jgi:hypothetical protein